MSELSPGTERTFGKILLFGEYTILLKGNALAIPLQNISLSGILNHDKEGANNPVWKDWLKYLLDLRPRQLAELEFDWDQFALDIAKGLIFESALPVGYGLGSSGALTAAVFQRYISVNQWYSLRSNFKELQKTLAIFESFFHGSSSGLDPLVSILNAPIQINGSTTLLLPHLNPESLRNWFLVDSGLPRQTSHLVENFRNKLDSEREFENKMQELKTVNNGVIQDFLNQKTELLEAGIRAISTIQFTQLDWLIPQNIKSYWAAGLDTNRYYFKLCGAGGGGFFLLYAPDREDLFRMKESLRFISLDPNELQL